MTRRLPLPLRVVGIPLVLGLVAALFTWQRGGLGHFSPYTLQYTTQSEFTVAGLPVYRSARQPVRNELVDFLVEEGFVAPVQPQKQRWEKVFHWNEAWRDGYGPLYPILVRDRDQVIEWTKADPERARLYWSEVFRLLRSEREADLLAGRDMAGRWRHCQSVADCRKWLRIVKAQSAEFCARP